MKDYTLWCNGVICGITIYHLIFGDYTTAGICAFLAALTFISWRVQMVIIVIIGIIFAALVYLLGSEDNVET